MPAIVSARGHTNVIMVMNLNRFVREEDREAFHSLRGTDDYRKALRDQLYPQILKSVWFLPAENSFYYPDIQEGMTTAEAGFATGIFRQNLLETFIGPVYRFNKKAYYHEFPHTMRTNFQFKKIFLPIWKSWDIFVRPSVFGMLVIQLVRKYHQATPLEQLASDVARLQTPFDIPSAIHWLDQLSKKLADDDILLEEKRQSVEELLRWLGGEDWLSGEENIEGTVKYSPAQWQLAMEVGKAFVKAANYQIQVGDRIIHLVEPPPQLSYPLHDSYVIYHIDDLYASPHLLPSYREQAEKRDSEKEKTEDKPSNKKSPERQRNEESSNTEMNQETDKQKEKKGRTFRRVVPVTIDDLYGSITVRRKLLNLLEGSLLRKPGRSPSASGNPSGSGRFFPHLRDDMLDSLRENNLASWHDELCVMNSRVALIMPSQDARECDLFISTMPSEIETSRVKYLQYWEAIERLIEFVAEIRVLAQLIEHSSSQLLQGCVDLMHQKRRGIVDEQRTEDLLFEFNEIISQTANLSRLLAIAQTLNNPVTWSRVEFALTKASYLLESCAIPLSLQHASENIANLNALVEHMDELFLADSTSKQDKLNFFTSIAFASLSMVLVLLMLPSFWADLHQLDRTVTPGLLASYLLTLNWTGTGLAFVLMVISLITLALSTFLLIKNFFRNHQS